MDKRVQEASADDFDREEMTALQSAIINKLSDELYALRERMLYLMNNLLGMRDIESGEHVKRVQSLTGILARYMTRICPEYPLDEESIRLITDASALHDVGKIAIPDAILLKPGRLTKEEYRVMQTHTTKGSEMIRMMANIGQEEYGKISYDICRYHHERYDGKGYIHGLKGEEIPLNARIIGIADAFDAMTANRVYRNKLDFEYVLEELRKGRGTQFDPQLVDILLGLIEDGTIDVSQIYGGTAGKES